MRIVVFDTQIEAALKQLKKQIVLSENSPRSHAA